MEHPEPERQYTDQVRSVLELWVSLVALKPIWKSLMVSIFKTAIFHLLLSLTAKLFFTQMELTTFLQAKMPETIHPEQTMWVLEC
jgi:hypothetical protein